MIGIGRILVLTVTIVMSTANAAAPVPTDYAEGFALEITQPGPLIIVPLSIAIYRAAVSDQLHDLAVFDADGKPVAHTIRLAPPDRAIPASRDVALPVFPYSEAAAAANPAVTISAGGALVRIETDAPRTDPRGHSRYILDASHVSERITALTIAFVDGEGEIMNTVAVDGSDDLDQWRTLVRERRVARLHYRGHTLTQPGIPLPAGPRWRYLRLRFLEPDPSPRIAQVLAQTAPITRAAPPSEQLRLTGGAADADSDAIEFDLGAALPVTAVAALMPANALFEATLQSRRARTANWETHYRATFYALERDGLLLRPGPRPIGPINRRYWRLTAFSPRPPATQALAFEVDWRPGAVIFLAGGVPPYTLAVGRSAAAGEPVPRTPVLTRFDDKELAGHATLGARRELGGDVRRSAARPLPWSRIALWLVLAAGVAAAALMVVRLLRQMRGA